MPKRDELVQRLNELRAKYNAAKQGHVFDKIHELNEDELADFIHDLQITDPEEINKWYQRTVESIKNSSSQQLKLQPFPDVSHIDSDSSDRTRWQQIGHEKISEGKLAVLLLAGGQGTRLGTKDPKGMYQIGLQSEASLFQLQAHRILKLQQLSGGKGVIPWYIMTSEATRPITVNYFAENNYFGLEKENVFFFEQDMIPCLTPEGKIIMESKSKISRAPNGNGGVYSALLKHGALSDMQKRGIEMVYIYGVDNVLIKMADPVFAGYCFDKDIDCAAKIVAKAYPEEPVGVVCLNNNQACVIEYSEIDKDLATKIDPNTGKLYYNTAHVCMNMVSLNFLKLFCESYLDQLPYHVAKKKIPSVTGDTNGWKLEMFIFDVFPFATKMSCFEVLRNEEFSPLKNGLDAKVDNPTTCLNDLSKLHMQWLKNAGANIEGEGKCEISPLVSYSGEGLAKYKGKTIKLPQYLHN